MPNPPPPSLPLFLSFLPIAFLSPICFCLFFPSNTSEKFMCNTCLVCLIASSWQGRIAGERTASGSGRWCYLDKSNHPTVLLRKLSLQGSANLILPKPHNWKTGGSGFKAQGIWVQSQCTLITVNFLKVKNAFNHFYLQLCIHMIIGSFSKSSYVPTMCQLWPSFREYSNEQSLTQTLFPLGENDVDKMRTWTNLCP